MADTTKKLTVGILAAVIIFTWGLATFNYFNPSSDLTREELMTVEAIIHDICPNKKLEFEARKVNGTLDVEVATDLVDRCNEVAISKQKFISDVMIATEPDITMEEIVERIE